MSGYGLQTDVACSNSHAHQAKATPFKVLLMAIYYVSVLLAEPAILTFILILAFSLRRQSFEYVDSIGEL